MGNMSTFQNNKAELALRSGHPHPYAELPYFPAPLPDQTIYSLIQRYQVMRGQKTIQQSCLELFGSSTIYSGRVVSRNLYVLAHRLPGMPAQNLEMLIRSCTFAPIYQTFFVTKPKSIDSIFTLLHGLEQHISHRIKLNSNGHRLCEQCRLDDMDVYGFSYTHRAHQIQGVTSCWKHGIKTTNGENGRVYPIKLRKNHALDLEQCPTRAEIKYANFTYRLLHRVEMVVDCDRLQKIYQERASELGFHYQPNLPVHPSLKTAMMDYYFFNERYSQFDMMNGGLPAVIRGCMSKRKFPQRPPIGHLLILAHFLFRDADIFLDALKSDEGIGSTK
jgi:hypothetical protein